MPSPPSLREKLRRPRASGSPYLNRMLLPDEYVIYTARLHGVVYAFGLVLTALGVGVGRYGAELLALLPLVPVPVPVPLPLPLTTLAAMALIGLGALMLFFAWLRQSTTELVVTNQRVISKHGLIATSVYEAMLTRITSIDIEQTVMGKLLNYGRVTVRGSSGGLAPLESLADPYRFYALTMRANAQAQHHHTPGRMTAEPAALQVEDVSMQKEKG